ncbi:hypothetical protein TNCV_1958371 [Trichonephila clavipes]|nr:hypothetical protein TNCV_1958371 [Trichonephila clavipes]
MVELVKGISKLPDRRLEADRPRHSIQFINDTQGLKYIPIWDGETLRVPFPKDVMRSRSNKLMTHRSRVCDHKHQPSPYYVTRIIC